MYILTFLKQCELSFKYLQGVPHRFTHFIKLVSKINRSTKILKFSHCALQLSTCLLFRSFINITSSNMPSEEQREQIVALKKDFWNKLPQHNKTVGCLSQNKPLVQAWYIFYLWQYNVPQYACCHLMCADTNWNIAFQFITRNSNRCCECFTPLYPLLVLDQWPTVVLRVRTGWAVIIVDCRQSVIRSR